MSTVETYERVLRAMNHEEPDRVPVWELLDNDKMYELFGGSGDPLEVSVKTHKRLGIDVIRGWSYGPRKDWLATKVRDVWGRFLGVDATKWTVLRREYIAWVAKRPFEDLDGLRKNLPHPPDESEVAEWYENALRPQLKAFSPEVVLLGGTEGPVTEAFTYTGWTLFFKAMYQAPDVITGLLDTFASLALAITKTYADNEFGPAFFLGEDVAEKNGPMFSPAWLRSESLRRLRRIYAPLKAKGIKVVQHSDGNLYRILDDWVEAGADGITPVEPAAGMNMAYVKERWGDKLFLVGNIDCSVTLPLGKPQDVEAETRKCIEDGAPGGGLLLGSSSEIHDGIPIENALAMINTAKKYGRYPLT